MQHAQHRSYHCLRLFSNDSAGSAPPPAPRQERRGFDRDCETNISTEHEQQQGIIDRSMACAWPVFQAVGHTERCRVCAGCLCCRAQSTFLSSNTSSTVPPNSTVSLLHQHKCRCMNELSHGTAVMIGATQADVDDVASALTESSVRLVSGGVTRGKTRDVRR